MVKDQEHEKKSRRHRRQRHNSYSRNCQSGVYWTSSLPHRVSRQPQFADLRDVDAQAHPLSCCPSHHQRRHDEEVGRHALHLTPRSMQRTRALLSKSRCIVQRIPYPVRITFSPTVGNPKSCPKQQHKVSAALTTPKWLPFQCHNLHNAERNIHL